MTGLRTSSPKRRTQPQRTRYVGLSETKTLGKSHFKILIQVPIEIHVYVYY